MRAEYQAMYAGIQELVWLRGVLGKIGRPEGKPTPFFVDSQGAEDLALNLVFHMFQRGRCSAAGACGVHGSGSGPIHQGVVWPDVRANTGYFVEYSEDTKDWGVYITSTVDIYIMTDMGRLTVGATPYLA